VEKSESFARSARSIYSGGFKLFKTVSVDVDCGISVGSVLHAFGNIVARSEKTRGCYLIFRHGRTKDG